jgi:hypothetical protein
MSHGVDDSGILRMLLAANSSRRPVIDGMRTALRAVRIHCRAPGAPFVVALALWGASCGPPYPAHRAVGGDEDGGMLEEDVGTGTGGSTGGRGGETGGSGGGAGTGGSAGSGGRGGSGGTGLPDAAGGSAGRDAASPDAAPDLGGADQASSPPDLADASAMCVTGMPGAFVNTPMPSQMGTFTVHVDATVTQALTNVVIALSNGPQTAYTGYAVAARFNSMGNIDALNVTPYAAVATIPYVAGKRYHFRLVVNLTAHTYSAYVTPAGGTELTIGTDYAFRTQQNTVASLNSWGVVVGSTSPGTAAACGFSVQ